MFELTDDQQEQIEKWKDDLPVAYTGAIGGRLTYSFTPTSLGVVVKVSDAITGRELDVTDYNEW